MVEDHRPQTNVSLGYTKSFIGIRLLKQQTQCQLATNRFIGWFVASVYP